MTFPFFISSWW